MGSSRFPGKPLYKILDTPMVGHVLRGCYESNLASRVIVATCDDEIRDYVKSIGGEAVMTSNKHERASDRCAEALLIVEHESRTRFDLVVMVQGDEPMVTGTMIDEALKPMIDDPTIKVSNLLGSIEASEELSDPNTIKVVVDKEMNAIYFSRMGIPWGWCYGSESVGRQVCIIPFRRDFLLEYTHLPVTPLEKLESIDMLRVVENGFKVRMIRTKHSSYPIDVPEDLARVTEHLSKRK